MEKSDVDAIEVLSMAFAGLASKQSTDRTKVGACIVTPNYDVVSFGWNGLPRGSPHRSHLSQLRADEKQWLQALNSLVIFACQNAIALAQKPLKDCILYTTHLPSSQCAGMINLSGIAKVVYYENLDRENNKKHALDSENARLILNDKLVKFPIHPMDAIAQLFPDFMAVTLFDNENKSFEKHEIFMILAKLAEVRSSASYGGACLVCRTSGRVVAITGESVAKWAGYCAVLERAKMTGDWATLYLTRFPSDTKLFSIVEWSKTLQAARIDQVFYLNGGSHVSNGQLDEIRQQTHIAINRWSANFVAVDFDLKHCRADKIRVLNEQSFKGTVRLHKKNDINLCMAVAARYGCNVVPPKSNMKKQQDNREHAVGVCLVHGENGLRADLAWNSAASDDRAHAEANLLLKRLAGVRLAENSCIYLTRKPCAASCQQLIGDFKEIGQKVWICDQEEDSGFYMCGSNKKPARRFILKFDTVASQKDEDDEDNCMNYESFFSTVALWEANFRNRTNKSETYAALIVSKGNDLMHFERGSSKCPALSAIMKLKASTATQDQYHTMFLSYPPCGQCTKIMVQSGFSRCFFVPDKNAEYDLNYARELSAFAAGFQLRPIIMSMTRSNSRTTIAPKLKNISNENFNNVIMECSSDENSPATENSVSTI